MTFFLLYFARFLADSTVSSPNIKQIGIIYFAHVDLPPVLHWLKTIDMGSKEMKGKNNSYLCLGPIRLFVQLFGRNIETNQQMNSWCHLIFDSSSHYRHPIQVKPHTHQHLRDKSQNFDESMESNGLTGLFSNFECFVCWKRRKRPIRLLSGRAEQTKCEFYHYPWPIRKFVHLIFVLALEFGL